MRCLVNEELTLIAFLSLVLEILAFLVITYKMETKKINKIVVIKGILIAILFVIFGYYVQLTISRVFPFISSITLLFMLTLMIFLIFNRFYGNSLIESLIKSGFALLINFICQLTQIPLFYVVSKFFTYEGVDLFTNYSIQIWVIVFMFWIYPKFKNKIDKIISNFSKHPKFVIGVSIYYWGISIYGSYIITFLVDNIYALISIFVLAAIFFIGLIFIVFNFYKKLKENPVTNKENINNLLDA